MSVCIQTLVLGDKKVHVTVFSSFIDNHSQVGGNRFSGDAFHQSSSIC